MPFTSLLISLTAETTYPILGALGRPAQAWFFRQLTRVSPALVEKLHDEQSLKPYTVSTLLDDNGRPLAEGSWLKPGQCCWLRITCLDEILSEIIENQVLPKLPDRLTLYKMDFRVDGVARNRAEHPWAGSSSYNAIAQDAALQAAGRFARMEFASPTAFRSNGQDVCLPVPGQVFRSLYAKWNAFCPEAMQLQEIWPQFADDCIFVNTLTALNSTHWTFAEGTHGHATGFTGTVEFVLPKTASLPEQWQPYADGSAAVMQSLAQFAFYAGVGHHATIGMGQTRLLPPIKAKIK
jgi:CRISPR-associated endoribonuclease Cas6